MKKYISFLFAVFCYQMSFAQFEIDSVPRSPSQTSNTDCSRTIEKYEGYDRKNIPKNYIPIGGQTTVGYLGNLGSGREKYVFEATPAIRLSILNSMQNAMLEKNGQPYALFIDFRPQIRMFRDSSLPIKTPSYKIGIGYQHLIPINTKNTCHRSFIVLAYETGHYSNGQAGAAFDERFLDGSAAGDSVYTTITPTSNLSDILNRKSGNFSTNFTDVLVKYWYVPRIANNYMLTFFAVETGITRYHDKLLYFANIGGYSDQDIKLYGKNIWYLNFEFMTTFKHTWLRLDRYKVNVNYEYLYKPHPSVTQSRIEIIPSVYWKNNIGLYLKVAFGHDTYNYRFVDNISHFGVGLVYDLFPNMEMNRNP